MPPRGPYDIAITGMSVLNALGETVEEFAGALFAGRSAVRDAPELEKQSGADVAALLDFDLDRWIERHLHDDPWTARRLRRVGRRVALPARTAACAAAAALRDTGLNQGERKRCGLVVAGSNLALRYQARTTLEFAQRPESVRPSHALTHLDVDVVGAVSEVTGLHAEGWTLGAASASSAIALIHAARLVHSGWLERCLVVGALAELSGAELRALRDSGAMAARGDAADATEVCRPFDAARRGFVYGQGTAAVLLERGTMALARNARIHAYVDGWGQVLDGMRGTEPDPRGQAYAMAEALESAGLVPDEIDYVNAHATGSVAGDESEATALLEVFGDDQPLVNSTKSFTGHCLTSAALQELVATTVQLRTGICHPNLNLTDPLVPAPGLVGTSVQSYPLRYALSNSFAFSGVNASILLTHPDRTVN